MKRLLAVAGLAALMLSVFYLVIVVRSGLGTLPAIHWTPTALAATVAGTLIYIGAVVIWSGGWATLLAAVGEPVGVFRNFIIIGVSQPAKYLPGNVAHHIGRAAFATQFGLGSLGVVLSIALEVFSLIAAAVVCALLAVALTNSTTATNLAPLATSTLAALVVGAIAVPIGGLLAARRWGKRMLRPLGDSRSVHVPDAAQSGLIFLTHIGTYLLQGAVLVVVARGVFGIPFSDYWLGVGAFALAFIAGFLAPGVPAGIGVREAVLVAGLSLEMSTGSALAVATAHRLINVAGDGIILGLALAGWRFLRPASDSEG